jgi:hypothetical protein
LFFQALWILAFFRRRKPIGGPLLVFFVQIFVKTAQSLVLIPAVLMAWYHRDRSVPVDKRIIYFALLILVTNFAAATVTAIAARTLLKTRSWRYVGYVRGGLCVLAAVAVVTLLHHVSFENSLDLVFPLVFLPYFVLSRRVQRAFHRPDL